jgi:hypothetical protein
MIKAKDRDEVLYEIPLREMWNIFQVGLFQGFFASLGGVLIALGMWKAGIPCFIAAGYCLWWMNGFVCRKMDDRFLSPPEDFD